MTAAKLSIVNGRVIDPGRHFDEHAALHLRDGRVAAIGRAPGDFGDARVFDAKGALVIPGLVDVAVRLREPGLEHRRSLRAELLAAVSGGVTSVVCPPDTDPPLDEPGLVDMLKHRARQLNLASVYPLGALTARLGGERLTEMVELAHAGCIGFAQADACIADSEVLYRAMQYAATFGLRVWLRPQDAFIGRNGVAHDGETATRLGLAGVPAISETIALDRMLRLARQTGAPLHVCRLSTAEGVDMIRQARRSGLAVTSDVGVCNLHLIDRDIGFFDPLMHLAPPLRDAADRAALRAGVRDGTIDVICSDHCPVDEDEKQLPFGEATSGASGVELLLGLVLKWATDDGVLLVDALAPVTSRPAAVSGIEAGTIAIDAMADLCVVDPSHVTPVIPSNMKSLGHNTPFRGVELPGRVLLTLVGGVPVHAAEGGLA